MPRHGICFADAGSSSDPASFVACTCFDLNFERTHCLTSQKNLITHPTSLFPNCTQIHINSQQETTKNNDLQGFCCIRPLLLLELRCIRQVDIHEFFHHSSLRISHVHENAHSSDGLISFLTFFSLSFFTDATDPIAILLPCSALSLIYPSLRSSWCSSFGSSGLARNLPSCLSHRLAAALDVCFAFISAFALAFTLRSTIFRDVSHHPTAATLRTWSTSSDSSSSCPPPLVCSTSIGAGPTFCPPRVCFSLFDQTFILRFS